MTGHTVNSSPNLNPNLMPLGPMQRSRSGMSRSNARNFGQRQGAQGAQGGASGTRNENPPREADFPPLPTVPIVEATVGDNNELGASFPVRRQQQPTNQPTWTPPPGQGTSGYGGSGNGGKNPNGDDVRQQRQQQQQQAQTQAPGGNIATEDINMSSVET